MNTTGAQNLVRMLFREESDSEASSLPEEESDLEASSLPQVEGYTLVKVIGRGGGGVVYEGIADAGRRVAIKFIRQGNTNTTSKALLEIDRLATVQSAVVPHVFEHGVVGGQVYMVTELIEGVSPIEFAEDLTIRQCVELLVKIAGAVGELNGYGLIHRDLKPGNILINSEGKPMILDLGISVAAELDHSEMIDHAGKPIGTLAYMAPEQARGETGSLSIQWDVYALGAIGYRLLTGSTPHELPESVTMGVRQVREQRARSPRDLNPKLPKQLSVVLEKACAWEASERYESVQLFRDDLQRWLNREPVLAGPQTGWMRVLRVMSKHPVLSVGAMCAMIFAISIASTSAMVWWQNALPYEFRWNGTDTCSSTSIVSRSNLELHRWETIDKKGIRFPGKLIDFQGEQYAVLGLEFPDINSGHQGLVGYRVGAYDEPAWIATQQVPKDLSYAVRHEPGPHRFDFYKLYIEDVFPEIEGKELISIHWQRPNSVCAIQIHRVNGELLSEYYHDGHLRSVYWEAKQGVLIATGKNSDGEWTERGVSQSVVGRYPLVVFAIRPEVGQYETVVKHSEMVNGIEPLWYKCLTPASSYWALSSEIEGVNIHATRPSNLTDQMQGYVDLQLGIGPDEYSLNLTINAQGEQVGFRASSGWGAATGMDPAVFSFQNLPARTTSRKQ